MLVSTVCWSLSAVGQAVAVAVAEPGLGGTPLIYQPVIVDTTLHFRSKELVCRCAYGEEEPAVEWYNANWGSVRKCECAREVYQLGLVWDPFFDRGTYSPKLISRDVRSTLTRTSDTTFVYEEVYHEHQPTLPERDLLFNTKNVVSTDSTYLEEPYSGEMKLKVERMVELKDLY